MKIDVDVNQFPSLTWNFLNINRSHLDSVLEGECEFKTSSSDDSVKISEVDFSSLKKEFTGVQTGLGSFFDSAFDEFSKNKKVLFIEEDKAKGCDSPKKTKIDFIMNADTKTAKDIALYARESSDAVFIFTFSGSEDAEGVLGARLRVVAEENARVKIVLVNLLGSRSVYFISAGSLVKDGACVDVTELQLGAHSVYSGNFQALEGYKAFCSGHVAYVAKKDSLFDFNYVARHTGRESESFMSVDGVCYENAKKTWRGTVDFIKGCIDSKGDEQENVLLLSPKVLNKTLPVILCDEEAVEGRHGASIGRLSGDVLFYMQSRGLSEKEARDVMVQAKIRSACRHIPDEQTVSLVEDFVSKKISI